jgi:hypothetical protein
VNPKATMVVEDADGFEKTMHIGWNDALNQSKNHTGIYATMEE